MIIVISMLMRIKFFFLLVLVVVVVVALDDGFLVNLINYPVIEFVLTGMFEGGFKMARSNCLTR